ncbi:MAG: hypothetical protein Kow0020_16090 [Wenzhouxiangellaceae bacterium]
MIIAPPGDRAAVSVRIPVAVMLITVLGLLWMLAISTLPGDAASGWIGYWGFRPSEMGGELRRLGAGEFPPGLLRLCSALLVHATWLHLLGNLAYLWVFGPTVERALGTLGFLLVFALLGAVANLAVVLQLPEMDRVVVGASGGISAIMGLYLGLYPSRRIGLWLPLGLFLQFARIPALLVIGSWFTLQLMFSAFGSTNGAVAWWTHVAGFVAGVVAAAVLRLIASLRRRSRWPMPQG